MDPLGRVQPASILRGERIGLADAGARPDAAGRRRALLVSRGRGRDAAGRRGDGGMALERRRRLHDLPDRQRRPRVPGGLRARGLVPGSGRERQRAADAHALAHGGGGLPGPPARVPR